MSESSSDLKRRIMAQLKNMQLERKFVSDFKNAFETVLANEQIVMARPERDRLFKQILWDVLTNMIEEQT